MFVTNISAQNIWTRLNPTTNPGPRDSHNMVWDTESQRAILYGSHSTVSNPAYYVETWAYDYSTNRWTKMNPSINPGARAEFAFAYNSVHDKVILFGGSGDYWPGGIPGRGKNNDTWAYDFNSDTWTNLNLAVKPDSIGVCRMAYDSESDKIILFDLSTGKTWAYDYASNLWQSMNPPNPKPPADWRAMTCITYDGKHDRIIALTPYSQYTWAYDYNTNRWQQRAASPNDPLSGGVIYDLDYDSASDKTVMYGDNLVTWSYDWTTDSWTNMNVILSPAGHHFAMTYMPQFNRLLFYGGVVGSNNQTWTYVFGTTSGINTTSDKPNAFITIYPNPFDVAATITINTAQVTKAEVSIYNLLGVEVKKIRDINSNQVTVTRENLHTGMYFYHVRGGGTLIGSGKLMVR